ncbi:MAG TPA: ATP-binding protein [Thermoanaerobaculia bacterium]|nr:ATP-binding protein [Thermoanaerobaculia bacterium]
MRKTKEAAESALRESEERFRAVVAALEEGIVLYEADGCISSCNSSACRILGLREDQLIGRTSRNPALQAVREDGSPFEPESHPATITLLTGLPCSRVVMGFERADGTLVWVSCNSRPLRRAGERDPYAVAVSFTDITQARGSVREMRWRADQQSVIADLASQALEGTPLVDLMDLAVRRVADVLDLARCGITDRMKLHLRAGVGWPERDEFPKGADHPSASMIVIPGRQRSWGFLIAHPRPGEKLGSEETRFLDSVATLLAMAAERDREESARRRTESRQERLQHGLRTSAQEWRLTFDAIIHPLLLIDLDGRIIRLNRAARDLSGVDYDKAVYHHVNVLGNGQPWRAIRELLAQVDSSDPDADDPSAQARDDQGRTWDITLSPVVSPDDQKGAVVVARDISDLVRLQESLRRSETMSAMGALVAGVAHEVRNPLFGISATLDAFESRFGRRKDFRRYFDVLQVEVKRLSELMHQLLDYGKPARLDLAAVTPDEVMAMAATACEPLASRSGVDVAVRSEGGLPQLHVDRGRIAQVFQNLLENAIQHSAKGKSVLFRAERLGGGDSGDRDGVRFAVEDAGPGFLPNDLHRVFEPFFTRRRGGTGLGLSIVQRIVEQHGGEVLASNLASGGAVMTVFLPLRPRRSSAASPHALPEMVRG